MWRPFARVEVATGKGERLKERPSENSINPSWTADGKTRSFSRPRPHEVWENSRRYLIQTARIFMC